jgi:hypothetical protein
VVLDQDKKYEAALLSLDMYNSIPNIIEGKNNAFKYSPDSGTTWKIITINTGAYELTAISNEIQRQMIANGDSDSAINITGNVSRLTSIVNIENQSYKVDFGVPNSIGAILGFEAVIIGFGYNESPNIVNIMQINSILVNIDIISGSYVKGISSSVIHSFNPEVPPGFKIIEKPTCELIWYPVSVSDISRMELKLTDQNENPIDIRGETLTVRIYVREVKEVKNIKEGIIQAIKYLKHEKIL